MFNGGEKPLRRMLSAFHVAGQASHVLFGKQSNTPEQNSVPEVNKWESCDFLIIFLKNLLPSYWWEPENLIDRVSCYFFPVKISWRSSLSC